MEFQGSVLIFSCPVHETSKLMSTPHCLPFSRWIAVVFLHERGSYVSNCCTNANCCSYHCCNSPEHANNPVLAGRFWFALDSSEELWWITGRGMVPKAFVKPLAPQSGLGYGRCGHRLRKERQKALFLNWGGGSVLNLSKVLRTCMYSKTSVK